MILEHIRLRGFGRFIEERRFPSEGDFHPGINVLAGENEVGKTTLFTALHHALFTPYTSTAREIKALQPWGTELAPRIEVYFHHADQRYRLIKGFLHDATCQLAVWRDGRYQPLADGDRADDRLRQFLLGEKPARGVAQEQHRGLARLLWMPQGEAASAHLEGELRNRVEASLGAITLDATETQLRDVLATQYATWWTRTGLPAKSSGLAAATERVEELRSRAQALAAELGKLDGLNARLTSIRQRQTEIEQQRAQLAQSCEQTEAKARRIEAIRAEWSKAKAHLETCAERFKAADRRREEFRQARQIEAEMTRQLEEREPVRERLASELRAAQQAREAAEAEVERAAEALRTSEQAWQMGRRVHQARTIWQQQEALQTRLAEAEALRRDYEQRRKTMDDMPAPAAAQIEAARRLEADLLRLSGRLEAVGLQLRFQAETPMEIEFSADGSAPETRGARAGEHIAFSAGKRAQLHVPGIGTLDVRSGAREAEAVERELEQRRAKLAVLLQPFRADDAAGLAHMHEARVRAHEQMKHVEQRLLALLHPQKSVSELRAAVAASKRQYEALTAEFDQKLSGIEAQTEPNVARLEAAFEKARSAEMKLRRNLQEHVQRIELLREQVTADQRREIELQTKRQQARDRAKALVQEAGSEVAIEEAYHDSRRERDAAQAQVTDLKQQLPEADDPTQTLEKMQATLQGLTAELADLAREETFCAAEIRHVTERGTHEELAGLEEELVTAEARRDKVWREARAIKLLHRLIEERQERVTRSLTEPVAKRVTRYFSRVSGLAERGVQFDAELMPATLSNREATGIPPEALSAGAREQMHNLTRLALARYLAQTEGRMLFVLDDTLVHTDPMRHRRFLEILEEAAADLQIIVLTCHSERFRGLRTGRFETVYN